MSEPSKYRSLMAGSDTGVSMATYRKCVSYLKHLFTTEPSKVWLNNYLLCVSSFRGNGKIRFTTLELRDVHESGRAFSCQIALEFPWTCDQFLFILFSFALVILPSFGDLFAVERPLLCELLLVRPRIQSIKRNYRHCRHKPLLLLAIPVCRWAFEASFACCSLLVSTFFPFACRRLRDRNLRSSGRLICHSSTERQENLPRCLQEPADSRRTSIIFMSQSCHVIVLKSYFIADL